MLSQGGESLAILLTLEVETVSSLYERCRLCLIFKVL
jgi:hypothetical protein